MITKGKVKGKGKETVSPVVNDERNLVIDDVEREGTEEEKKLNPVLTRSVAHQWEEARKKQEMEGILEKHRVKKMNKTAIVKHQAKKEARVEAEKIIKELAERAKINKNNDRKEEREERMLSRALGEKPIRGANKGGQLLLSAPKA